MPAWPWGSYPAQPGLLLYFQDHSTRFSEPEKLCDTRVITIPPPLKLFLFRLGVCSLVWFFTLHRTTRCARPYLPKSWIASHAGATLPSSSAWRTRQRCSERPSPELPCATGAASTLLLQIRRRRERGLGYPPPGGCELDSRVPSTWSFSWWRQRGRVSGL